MCVNNYTIQISMKRRQTCLTFTVCMFNMNLSGVCDYLDSLYGDNAIRNAHQASQIDRGQLYYNTTINNNTKLNSDTELIYGELLLSSVNCIIRYIFDHIGHHITTTTSSSHNNDTYKFIDLGSGNGRCCIGVSLLFSDKLSLCCGIELLPSLHNIADNALEQLNSTHPNIQCTPCEFILGDFVKFDWHNYNIVYMNSTMYSNELMIQLSRLCERLSLGSYVITVSNQLHKSALRMFQLIHTIKQPSSYGTSTCYIYKKMNNNKLANIILRAYK